MEELNDIIRTTPCCGVRMIYGIEDFFNLDDIIYTVALAIRDRKPTKIAPHYLFTDNEGEGEGGIGESLAARIRELNLGVVLETSEETNTNSGNELRAYIWTPDKVALSTWLETTELVTVFEGTGFAVGSFVRFHRNSPNRFEGRGQILSGGRTIRIRTKDGAEVNILPQELSNLKLTRGY